MLIAYVLLPPVCLITYLLLPLSAYELFCVSDVHECALAPCLSDSICTIAPCLSDNISIIASIQISNLFVEALETGKKWTPNNKIKCQANSIVKVVTIL
jgi:hypothetical protein